MTLSAANFIRPLYRKFRAGILHYLIPRSRAAIFADGRAGVEVVGLFYSASGIGESARLCARQLAMAGYKVRCRSVEQLLRKPREIAWDFADTATDADIGCRIIHLNPPMLPPVAIRMGFGAWRRIYNIGYWAWELEEIPSEWVRALRYINAVFCPSDFTSRTIRKYTDRPVITVPHPVTVPEVGLPDMRRQLGIADDVFLASSIFSFGSALERKNPQGAIDAFLAAFGGSDKACLVLKSNAGGASEDKRKIVETIKASGNIRLIDDLWTREQVLGLMKASDIYISLHRSEGFGLPIAEAMLLGTPAIVTDWSGNTDFCTAENGFPVRYTMIPVVSDHPEFRDLTRLQWADADAGQAADILRRVAADREGLQAMSDRCAKDARTFFGRPVYAEALARLRV